MIIDDTQQQQHRDDPEKVFKSVILALSRLQAAQKIQASITHVHKANLESQRQGPPQYDNDHEVSRHSLINENVRVKAYTWYVFVES